MSSCCLLIVFFIIFSSSRSSTSALPLPPPPPAISSPSSLFHNYTLPSYYINRWPVSKVKDMRGVVVSVWAGPSSENLVRDLRKSWPINHRNFFVPMKDHADLIIFYSVFPSNSYSSLHQLVEKELHWEKLPVPISANKHTIQGRLLLLLLAGNYTLHTLGEEYITNQGFHILLFPIAINLPDWMVNDIGVLNLPKWRFCMGSTFSLDYILFSGAIFIETIITHPILGIYDYYLKLDLDMRFEQGIVSPSPFEIMRTQGCVFLHSGFTHVYEDCTLQSGQAAMNWATASSYSIPSNQTAWFHSQNGFFFGNFIGTWLGWVRSKENRSLMKYLYQEDQIAGYFQYRWGDQPIWSLMLGSFYDLTDEEVAGEVGSPVICDLVEWRNKNIFIHSKD